MTTRDPIPAIVETEATGETAAVFAELRTVLGVPFVNLIWRHLATIPGGLDWTWSLLRPLYGSAALEEAAQALCARINVACLPLDGFVYDAVGVDTEARRAIAALIVDYNRANALNFLALSMACRVLRGEHLVPTTAAPRAASAVPSPGVVGVATPPLPTMNALSPALHALVLDFDSFGRIAPSTAVASLYRHLGHWPGFLALAHTALAASHRDGRLRMQQEMLIERSREIVTLRLEPLLPAVPPLPGAAERDRILLALDEFTRLMIGRMVVMGTALLALLPGEAMRPRAR
ncbi:MAG: hypothetical protein ACRYHQ_00390 [Janthinobacterium lividum]